MKIKLEISKPLQSQIEKIEDGIKQWREKHKAITEMEKPFSKLTEFLKHRIEEASFRGLAKNLIKGHTTESFHQRAKRALDALEPGNKDNNAQIGEWLKLNSQLLTECATREKIKDEVREAGRQFASDVLPEMERLRDTLAEKLTRALGELGARASVIDEAFLATERGLVINRALSFIRRYATFCNSCGEASNVISYVRAEY